MRSATFKRLAAVGVVFFMAKGIAWLAVGALALMFGSGWRAPLL